MGVHGKPTGLEKEALSVADDICKMLVQDFDDSLASAKAQNASAEQLTILSGGFMLGALKAVATVTLRLGGSWLSMVSSAACIAAETFNVTEDSGEGQLHKLLHHLHAEFSDRRLPELKVGSFAITPDGNAEQRFGSNDVAGVGDLVKDLLGSKKSRN